MKLLVVLFRADAGGRRYQGEGAFKLLQNGEVQNGLNPDILPKKALRHNTPNALRHTVNSVTEARCGFKGYRLCRRPLRPTTGGLSTMDEINN